MSKDVETKEYRFNEARHLHELLVDGEWKSLTGCTTILGVLAKPALIPWVAKMTAEYVAEKWLAETSYSSKEIEDILKEAKSAHRKKKEEAGVKGTDVHSEVEKLVAGQIEGNNGIIEPDTKSDIPQVQHFINWAIKNKVKFMETEKGVYSKELFVGGILDLIVEIDNQLWIADIKTGSGIYPEHFAQMAGYELMMSEMGYPPLTGSIVLNLKKDGTFEEKRSVSNEDAKNFFLACVQCYRLQEKFNSLINN